jgi:glycerol-3-phosphate dehydrogenase (NAD(P)+)
MTKIVVLGAGMMGTAITTPLGEKGHDIHLVGTHLDGDIIEEIHEHHFHPRLRSYVNETVKPYTHLGLEEAMVGAELVILGVNSQGVDWAAEMLGPVLPPGVPVVMLTKGLSGDGQNLHLLPEVFRNRLPASNRNQVQIAAIGGPSIAGELAARRHTCIVLTGTNQELLDTLSEILRTPYYHVWTSTDMVGVEVCVALKNLYSLAVGSVQGFLEKEGVADRGAVMHNLAATLFAQGVWEMAYLVKHMGGSLSTIYSLPGVGDLYVTSQGGRNTRMGRLLGLGMRYQEAKVTHMLEDTIEGADLAHAVGPTVLYLVEHGQLDKNALPLLLRMIDIICNDALVQFLWDDFFAYYSSKSSPVALE